MFARNVSPQSLLWTTCWHLPNLAAHVSLCYALCACWPNCALLSWLSSSTSIRENSSLNSSRRRGSFSAFKSSTRAICCNRAGMELILRTILFCSRRQRQMSNVNPPNRSFIHSFLSQPTSERDPSIGGRERAANDSRRRRRWPKWGWLVGLGKFSPICSLVGLRA